jgi:hypothetical protein
MIKVPYAQESVLSMSPDVDRGAPGAAITVALCGHWEHDPPCPLAPHYTSLRPTLATPTDDRVVVRTLFATEARNEIEVRRRIEAALAAGDLPGSDESAHWALISSAPSRLLEAEFEHGRRLARENGGQRPGQGT